MQSKRYRHSTNDAHRSRLVNNENASMQTFPLWLITNHSLLIIEALCSANREEKSFHNFFFQIFKLLVMLLLIWNLFSNCCCSFVRGSRVIVTCFLSGNTNSKSLNLSYYRTMQPMMWNSDWNSYILNRYRSFIWFVHCRTNKKNTPN